MDTFNQYQDFTQSKAVYNELVWLTVPATIAELDEGKDDYFVYMPYTYPAFAIAEEAGEVCGKIAKFVRKSNQGVGGETLPRLREDIGKELGDLLFQLSETARQFGFKLQDIVDMNVAKLDDRQARGVLVGEGDNR